MCHCNEMASFRKVYVVRVFPFAVHTSIFDICNLPQRKLITGNGVDCSKVLPRGVMIRMPRTKGGAVPRKNIRIPKPMMDAVDEIVKTHPELFLNRQQFIEDAIRQSIERIRGFDFSKEE